MELVQSDTLPLRHPVTSNKIDGSKVSLLTKIKPEHSDILYKPTHFPDPLMCPLYLLFYIYTYNCGVMVSVLALSMVDHG